MSIKIKKIYILIVITLAIILNTLFLPNNVNARGTWQGNMPEKAFNKTTGMFPQRYTKDRIVTLPKDILNPKEWNAQISNGTIYCADQGKMLRFGKFDNKTYYIKNENNIYNNIRDKRVQELANKIIDELKNTEGKPYNTVKDIEIKADDVELLKTLNPNEAVIEFGAGLGNEQAFKYYISQIMQSIIAQIDKSVRPENWSADIDSSNNIISNIDNFEFGPKIVVMENSNKEERIS